MVLKTDEDGRLVRMRDVVREDRYAVRLRLDPARLAARALKPADVVAALARAGIPARPDPDGVPSGGEPLVYLLNFRGRAAPTETEVADRRIKDGPSGQEVRLGDLAAAPRGAEHGVERAPGYDELGIELGAQSYDQTCTLDGKPSVALSVYQLPGS